jgi:DNA-binding IclR family transcriptional regulator
MPGVNFWAVSFVAKKEGFQSVQSLERAILILETLSAQLEWVSLKDLATAVNLHPSTVYRMVATFTEHGYIEKNPETGRYRLGMKIIELGSQLLGNMELRTEAQPFLHRLMKEIQETIHLGILDDGFVIYIEKLEPIDMTKMYSQIGKRSPVHCTGLGKVLLAYQSDEKIDFIVHKRGLKQYTEITITTEQELWTEINKIRARGYAIDNGEHEPFVRCVAAPIYDYRGKAVAAISVTVPALRFVPNYANKLTSLVLETCAEISQSIGYVAKAHTQISGS